jgi:hypothetical protein
MLSLGLRAAVPVSAAIGVLVGFARRAYLEDWSGRTAAGSQNERE